MSRIVLLDLKLTPMSILAILKQRKIFSFSTFLGRLWWEKSSSNPPDWWILPCVFRIKIKIHKVWASSSERFPIGIFEFGHLNLWTPGPDRVKLLKIPPSTKFERDQVIILKVIQVSSFFNPQKWCNTWKKAYHGKTLNSLVLPVLPMYSKCVSKV